MSMSDEIAALAAPVSDAAPQGEDLRGDYSPQSLYYRLRDARAEARAAERAADAGESDDTAAASAWRSVSQLAAQALAKSKDLEIAAWFTEAALRSDGLGGLRDGFMLMHALVEGYWDNLFPLPDEDGVATRVAPVTGLNGEGGDGTLIQPLRKLTMFNRADGAPMPFWQYEQSAEVSAMGDATRRQQRLAAGVPPFDEVEKEARAAGSKLAPARDACEAACDAWRNLSDALDRHAGADSPPTSRVRDLLAQIAAALNRYAPPPAAGAAAEAVETENAASEAPSAGPAAQAASRPGQIATREDALRVLTELSAFFRRTEPHSPLAYTLDEAVRRARMSWPDLLEELVPDQTSRAAILNSLGIRPPPPAA